MLLKENCFISLYGCFEASITLSKGRWGISWAQEKYFLSSMYFKACLNHMHADHMWKWDGQRSPMLSKVRTTVSQMTWLDKSHHPYAGLQCYSWGSAPAGAVCTCPPAISKRHMTPLESTARLAQDMKVSSGRFQGLSRYSGRWCDPVTMHLSFALSLSIEDRTENLVAAEILKIASSSKSWIDPELILSQYSSHSL